VVRAGYSQERRPSWRVIIGRPDGGVKRGSMCCGHPGCTGAGRRPGCPTCRVPHLLLAGGGATIVVWASHGVYPRGLLLDNWTLTTDHSAGWPILAVASPIGRVPPDSFSITSHVPVSNSILSRFQSHTKTAAFGGAGRAPSGPLCSQRPCLGSYMPRAEEEIMQIVRAVAASTLKRHCETRWNQDLMRILLADDQHRTSHRLEL
jgi:hypothetical protein